MSNCSSLRCLYPICSCCFFLSLFPRLHFLSCNSLTVYLKFRTLFCLLVRLPPFVCLHSFLKICSYYCGQWSLHMCVFDLISSAANTEQNICFTNFSGIWRFYHLNWSKKTSFLHSHSNSLLACWLAYAFNILNVSGVASFYSLLVTRL